MAKNIFLAVLSTCILITFSAGNVSAEKKRFEEIAQVYISEYPPFMFTKDGEVTGFATEIVHEIMKRLDVSYDIKSLPLKRAYRYLLEEPKVMMFTVTRTKSRENLLKPFQMGRANNNLTPRIFCQEGFKNRD
jgi:polar amino acid transport system substrate-binding protein